MSSSRPVVAVIQARMSSSRLPGKVLVPIAGKPLLWHLVHRLRKCSEVDSIVIATSTDSRDDALEDFCRGMNVRCIRGGLSNVLSRYRLAAEVTGAQILLRITGDSPLIDPEFVDYLVAGLRQANADFVQLSRGARCAHEGVDAFSRRALDWLMTHAADDPVAQEHVTSWFKLHPDAVKTVFLPDYTLLASDHVRLSVDTADDLDFVQAVYERLRAPPGEARLADILSLIRDEPHYRDINAHVRQKSMTQRERRALVICQGGGSSGLGHVRRSLSLARALRDVQGIGVAFVAPQEVAAMISAAGFVVHPDLSVIGLAGKEKFDIAVIDVKDSLTRDDIAALAAKIPVVAVIDDGSDRRLPATHAYYPPVPQARELSWTGSACRIKIGWQWCILGFDPAHVAVSREKGLIVVSMGGADPMGLTDLALDALKLMQAPFRADFVIGPAFASPDALASRIDAQSPAFHAIRNMTDLPALFARCDMALVAFGVTAYELAALGVPALYLPISEDHVRSASVFADAGAGDVLPTDATVQEIADAVAQLLADDARRAAMIQAGRRTIDGRGASRIAADLAMAANQTATGTGSSEGVR
ncbi:MAG TPA: NTP transferase domain-containing protein [Rhizomicrobium sp.]|nr:NTP transferase domain-containing protein [Rhizomicrobium sp.]